MCQTTVTLLTAGGARGTPPVFAVQGTELEEQNGGNGAKSMTSANSSRCYLLPNTREETGSTQGL